MGEEKQKNDYYYLLLDRRINLESKKGKNQFSMRNFLANISWRSYYKGMHFLKW